MDVRKQFLILVVAAAVLLFIVLILFPESFSLYERRNKSTHKNQESNQKENTPDQIKKESNQEENMTPDQIGKLQWSRVDEFCKIYGNMSRAMPDDRQILVNDEAKTAFCFVPKSGCTTMKFAFFLALHAIPLSVLHDKSQPPDNTMMMEAVKRHSLIGRNKTGIGNVIKNYYKFVMYRNPVERLVSGYLSKIYDHPMIGLKSSEPERNWIRLETYKLAHPLQFEEWKRRGASEAITISFPDFIQYWIKTGGMKIDEHFRTTFDLCAPCTIRYSYYGNFNTYTKDVGVLSDRIHGNMSYLLNPKIRSMGTTSSVTPKFYSKITDEQKKEIINILAIDLLLYYTLFPAERDSHKAIMGVDYDVPSVISSV